jgi:hypothetical protein
MRFFLSAIDDKRASDPESEGYRQVKPRKKREDIAQRILLKA